LNNIGYNQADLIVILNDNKMSISPNVGAMSDYLKKLSDISVSGKPRRELGTIFEKLGFRYFGPIDGHNVGQIIDTINQVRTLPGPKLIHVLTEKGKGFPHAEEDKAKWHQSAPFDKVTGEANGTGKTNYTKIFAETFTQLAEKDQKIIGITAAMATGTGMIKFAEKFPKRFYDVGISEQHAVTFAAGLALEGLKPCAAIYSTFLQRAFDQVIQDVALQELPVRFFIDKASLTDDGPTQCGILDYSYLRLIPNMTVMAAKDEAEFRDLIYTAVQYDKGPISLRYPRAAIVGVEMPQELKEMEIGKAELLKEGEDVAIIGIGSMVQEAIRAGKILGESGINASVVNARFVKPLDEKLLMKEISKSGKVITMEENVVSGGFGSAVLEMIEKHGFGGKDIRVIAAQDRFYPNGDSKKMKIESGMTAENCVEIAKKILKKK
ncbi:MAG: 1-deoxy-D-xylulose-5-phosphate synthase, partial [archaeon]